MGAGLAAFILTQKLVQGGTFDMGKLVPSVASLSVGGLGVIGVVGTSTYLFVEKHNLNSALTFLTTLEGQLNAEKLKLISLINSLDNSN